VTIIVGIATPDGIVLASESRTTRSTSEGHRILSDSAQKVFSIGDRFGVATAGLAFIGSDTIAGVMDRFLAHVDEDDTRDIEKFSAALKSFFDERFLEWLAEIDETWDPDEHGSAIQFLVCGYDDYGIGHIREVTIPGDLGDSDLPNTVMGGVIWRGQTDVIRRLVKGVDWAGINVELPDDALEALRGLEYESLFPITVQDALDYAAFLVRTTIDMQRFSDGTVASPGLVPGCGGPLQLLVVDRDGADWAQAQTRSAHHD
jgi:hypothetical protein